MGNVKNTMLERILSVVAPHHCCGCDKIGTLLCEDCKYNIMQSVYVGCIVCRKPNLRGICKKHAMPYQQVWTVGERTGVLQRLIGGFKFQHMKAASNHLAELLHDRLPELPSNTIVVPVPTAASHIRERGYDHILLVAQQLAQKRHLVLDKRLLQRQDTATQHSANRKDRIRQATSAFRTTREANPAVNYLIIDDVVTTGSTIEQAARLLTNAGARSVWVAAIARQPLD